MRTEDKIRLLWVALVLFSFLLVSAESLSANDSKNSVLVEALRASPSLVISEKVQENHTFYGLASFYNTVVYYTVSENELRKIDEGESIKLIKS